MQQGHGVIYAESRWACCVRLQLTAGGRNGQVESVIVHLPALQLFNKRDSVPSI
jgi:hypothetical protein